MSFVAREVGPATIGVLVSVMAVLWLVERPAGEPVRSYVRQFLGAESILRAHYLNFAVWGAATLHGLGSGTDRSTPWLLGIYSLAVVSVCGLTVWRVLRSRRAPRWIVHVGPLAVGGAALVVVAALALGPLRFQPKHWNAMSFQDT